MFGGSLTKSKYIYKFLGTGWPQNSNKSDSPFPNYIVNHEGLNGIFGKFIILETIW